VRALRDGVPVALDELIASLLAKYPRERPEDAEQVAHDLSRIRCELGRTSPVSAP
jgi:hypothetical protein